MSTLNEKKMYTKILTSMDEPTKVVHADTSTTSIPANQGTWKYASVTIPSGYTPLCFKTYGVNHGWINITSTAISVSGNTLTIGFFCQNITNAAIDCSAGGDVILVKTS